MQERKDTDFLKIVAEVKASGETDPQPSVVERIISAAQDLESGNNLSFLENIDYLQLAIEMYGISLSNDELRYKALGAAIIACVKWFTKLIEATERICRELGDSPQFAQLLINRKIARDKLMKVSTFFLGGEISMHGDPYSTFVALRLIEDTGASPHHRLAAANASVENYKRFKQKMDQENSLRRIEQAKDHPDYKRLLEMVNNPLLKDALFRFWEKFRNPRYRTLSSGQEVSEEVPFNLNITEGSSSLVENKEDAVDASFTVDLSLGDILEEYWNSEFGKYDGYEARSVGITIEFVWHGTDWSEYVSYSGARHSASYSSGSTVQRSRGLDIHLRGRWNGEFYSADFKSFEELIQWMAEAYAQ